MERIKCLISIHLKMSKWLESDDVPNLKAVPEGDYTQDTRKIYAAKVPSKYHNGFEVFLNSMQFQTD